MEWKPKRWITIDPKTGKESLASPPAGATYMPWSAGPRICPGKKFSQVEFVAVISTLLRSCRIEPWAIEGKMKSVDEAKKALMEVVYDSETRVTPRIKNPQNAGVVFVDR